MASVCGSSSVAASTSFLVNPKALLSQWISDGKATSILSSSSSLNSVSYRRSRKSSRIVSAFGSAESPLQPFGAVVPGLSRKAFGSPKKFERKYFDDSNTSNGVIEARANPPIMPAVITPGGPLDLTSVMFRNRIIFIGQPIYAQVAQRIISQLVTLSTIDEDADILMYLNCPGGSIYSIMAVYDCMSWIKPKVGTVGFGVVASQAALLLAGGEKGMRYAMPNTRIMIHQPQSGCGGHVEDVRRQANEAVLTRHKVDMMFASFTGQPLEKVQLYTERDRFLSPAEAMEFGFIDGILETEN